jgi:hypothetical protein
MKEQGKRFKEMQLRRAILEDMERKRIKITAAKAEEYQCGLEEAEGEIITGGPNNQIRQN